LAPSWFCRSIWQECLPMEAFPEKKKKTCKD
jgi:hypothetical protein